MQTCPSCGSELTGPYCNMCGGKAPDDKAVRKPRKEAPKAHAPAAARKQTSVLAPNRIWKTTAQGLLGLMLFGAGMVAGFYLANDSSDGGPLESTTVDATQEQLPAVALGSKYMDEGVDYMTKNERAAAGNSFRKAITEFEKALKEDPNDQYARTYLGLTYYYSGDTNKAVSTSAEVLAKDPNYLWAIFNLAWISETSGKKTEAAAYYQKYLDVVQTERQNQLKYVEQQELVDRQVEAAKKALEGLKGGTTK